MANKLISFLKKNKEGAIIGGVLFVINPVTLITINILPQFAGQSSPMLSAIVSFFIGTLVGAWIQSKIKK